MPYSSWPCPGEDRACLHFHAAAINLPIPTPVTRCNQEVTIKQEIRLLQAAASALGFATGPAAGLSGKICASVWKRCAMRSSGKRGEIKKGPHERSYQFARPTLVKLQAALISGIMACGVRMNISAFCILAMQIVRTQPWLGMRRFHCRPRSQEHASRSLYDI